MNSSFGRGGSPTRPHKNWAGRGPAPTVFLFSLLACTPRGETPPKLELLRFAQGGREDILLNEKLVFRFNQPLDPASLHFESLSLKDSKGKQAAGRFQLSAGGREILFFPAPVLSASLEDGGFRPKENYEIEIAGFPKPQSLRSAKGALLEHGVHSHFQIMDPDQVPLPFEDRSSLPAGLVEIHPRPPRVGEPFELRFTKPLAPNTVLSKHFYLLEEGPGEPRRPVEIRVALLQNEEDSRIQINAREKLNPKRPYRLEISDALRDFSGNPVVLWNRPGTERAIHLFFSP